MLVYHFLDPNLSDGWDTLRKRMRVVAKVGVDFEKGEIGTSALLHTCNEGWRKFYAEPVCFFIVVVAVFL